VPPLKAKRAVEAALEKKSVALVVPLVEDLSKLAAELRECGFAISSLTEKPVDVKGLRERLGLTQEEFALRFGLELDAVRNWEYGSPRAGPGGQELSGGDRARPAAHARGAGDAHLVIATGRSFRPVSGCRIRGVSAQETSRPARRSISQKVLVGSFDSRARRLAMASRRGGA